MSRLATAASLTRLLSDEALEQDFPAVARAGTFISPEQFDRGLKVVLQGLKLE